MAADISHNQDDEITGINIVPLVDIVLVLLIIFMVTANFMAKPAIDMELPAADTGDSKERNQFSLLLGKDGSVAIGDRVVAPANIGAEFQTVIDGFMEEKRQSAAQKGADLSNTQLLAMAHEELTMIIQADTLVSHGRVIHYIDEARKAGILKYAFNVDPKAAKAAPAQAEEPGEDAAKSAEAPTGKKPPAGKG